MRHREKRPPHLRIGLKYCGGCRAEYDRVRAVNRLKERLGCRVAFVPPDAPDADGFLIVTGCPAACVDREPFAGKRVWTMGGPEECRRVIDEITKELEERSGLERTLPK